MVLQTLFCLKKSCLGSVCWEGLKIWGQMPVQWFSILLSVFCSERKRRNSFWIPRSLKIKLGIQNNFYYKYEEKKILSKCVVRWLRWTDMCELCSGKSNVVQNFIKIESKLSSSTHWFSTSPPNEFSDLLRQIFVLLKP